MATVDVSLTPIETIFPFTGITEVVRDRSEVPRAELFYSLLSGSIAAAGAGDDTRVNVAVTLPRNFAYVLIEANVYLDQAAGTTFGWDSDIYGSLTDGNSTTRLYNYNFFLEGSSVMIDTQQDRPRKVYQLLGNQVPNIVCLPREGGQAICSLSFGSTGQNVQTNAQLFLRFLQYDVTQAHHFDVNTPTFTR